MPPEFSLCEDNYQMNQKDSLITLNSKQPFIYFQSSNLNMKLLFDHFRKEQSAFTNADLLAFLGFFIGVGRFMENNLLFHDQVTLKNLVIVHGKLYLLNPLLSDSFVQQLFKVRTLSRRTSSPPFPDTSIPGISSCSSQSPPESSKPEEIPMFSRSLVPIKI